MGEIKERPKLGTVAVKVETGKGKPRERREGVDLNDVLRAIVFDLKESAQWSTAEMARRVGLPQSTLAEFLDEDDPSGLSLDNLAKLCAGLKRTPVELLQQHEKYAPANRGAAPFAEDFVFGRFRAVLDAGEASRLIRVLELLKDVGALDQVLETAERLIPTHLPIRRRVSKGPVKT